MFEFQLDNGILNKRYKFNKKLFRFFFNKPIPITIFPGQQKLKSIELLTLKIFKGKYLIRLELGQHKTK